MKSAIIRLARKVVISSDETHSELKKMWNDISENIEDFIRRRAGEKRLNWKNIHNRYKEEFNKDASHFGMAALQLLRNRLPDHVAFSTKEKEIKIEFCRTEIYDFTEEPNSLILHYFFITENLLLIDSVGDRLVLSKKEALDSYQKGEVVQDTFTINLNNNFDIVEYIKIK